MGDLIIGLGLLFYVLPMVVAKTRQVENYGMIAAVNLFLGWTVLGWLAALIWACTEKVEVPRTSHLSTDDKPSVSPNKGRMQVSAEARHPKIASAGGTW